MSRRPAITAAASGRSGVRPADDFYRTLEDCTWPLFDVIDFPHRIAEPACGDGAIAELFRLRGHEVVATDLYDHGYAHAETGVDFLTETVLRAPAIVTNPPFGEDPPLVEPFVRKAMQLGAELIVLFLRLDFLASINRAPLINRQRYAGKTHGLSEVHVLVPRPTLKPEGVVLRNGGAMNYAWFVWRRGYRGPATVQLLKRAGK